DGLRSKEYEVGAPIKFVVRDARLERGRILRWYEESSVSVAGRFESPETYHGLMLAKLNGAWFLSSMNAFGRAPHTWDKLAGIPLQDNEYWFVIRTRNEAVGRELYQQMLQLK